jgi:hypothetical protein
MPFFRLPFMRLMIHILAYSGVQSVFKPVRRWYHERRASFPFPTSIFDTRLCLRSGAQDASVADDD